MNIAIFTPSQNPYSETFIQAHKKYLEGNVFYYYGTRVIQLENGELELRPKEKRGLRYLHKLRATKKQNNRELRLLHSLEKNNIDVVLIEYGNHAHRLLPLLKKAALPFVVHFHGFDASKKDTLAMTKNYGKVFEEANAIIAVSKKMESMLLDLGCPREKLHYNVYGPQPEFLEVQPKFSKRQLVGIGRFTDKKAPYYTILAFNKIAREYPDVQLVIAGDGVLLNTCKNLVRYLGITNQVRLPGVITSEEYRELLAESLAFVQHSIVAEDGDMEGTPLAILEASAAGLPIISTKHAGIPDVVGHNETGLLCEEHDVDVMAENMRRILDDKEKALLMGQKGKERIHNYFSLERHIKQLESILKSVI